MDDAPRKSISQNSMRLFPPSLGSGGTSETPNSPGVVQAESVSISETSRDVGVFSLLIVVASSLASYFRTKRAAASSSSSSKKGTEQRESYSLQTARSEQESSCGRARPHTPSVVRPSNLGDSVTRVHGWQNKKAKTAMEISHF